MFFLLLFYTAQDISYSLLKAIRRQSDNSDFDSLMAGKRSPFQLDNQNKTHTTRSRLTFPLRSKESNHHIHQLLILLLLPPGTSLTILESVYIKHSLAICPRDLHVSHKCVTLLGFKMFFSKQRGWYKNL